jgi:DNA-binding NtrC family response regulator
MKEGAKDYVTKPFTPDELRLVLDRALKERALQEENERLRHDLRSQHGLDNIVGRAPSMRQLFEMARRVARTDTTVLVQGESGTGKELFARAIHVHSDRATQQFVTVNCGSIVGTLIESELFGHLKGAFTGAHANKAGLVTVANHGTLFLDEIGELPLDLQPKLLRLLQEGEVKPVGGVETRKVDVRSVAATNRDLGEDVKSGRFREDLYYRLNVICLRIPPLRERPEDIPLLADRFLRAYSHKARRKIEGFTEPAIKYLQSLPWPGNVRELQNTVERAVILSSGNVLDVADLTPLSAEGTPPPAGGGEPERGSSPMPVRSPYPFENMTLEEVERHHIEFTMQALGGQKTKVSEVLGINRTTLWKKLRQYDEAEESQQPEDEGSS